MYMYIYIYIQPDIRHSRCTSVDCGGAREKEEERDGHERPRERKIKKRGGATERDDDDDGWRQRAPYREHRIYPWYQREREREREWRGEEDGLSVASARVKQGCR